MFYAFTTYINRVKTVGQCRETYFHTVYHVTYNYLLDQITCLTRSVLPWQLLHSRASCRGQKWPWQWIPGKRRSRPRHALLIEINHFNSLEIWKRHCWNFRSEDLIAVSLYLKLEKCQLREKTLICIVFSYEMVYFWLRGLSKLVNV